MTDCVQERSARGADDSAERQRVPISVMIVNWNGRHFLETCLLSLRRQTFQDFETILVDNGSTDGSTEYVRSCFPEVKLISLPENRGFTGGNIAGWEQARGELIVLLNNDTEAHPQWLEEIDKASRAFPRAGFFASKMLQFDERNRIDNCGFTLTPTGVANILGLGEEDGAEWSVGREVFGACGGAAAYRSSMLEDVGFLDPDFFMIFEDVDLAFRAQLRGHKCVYLPEAMVYHRHHGTLKSHSSWQVLFAQRNKEMFYFTNMPLGPMVRAIPRRMLHEAAACAYFCALGHGSAFVRGKLDFLRTLGRTLRKRKEIQRSRTVSGAQFSEMLDRDSFLTGWQKLSHRFPAGLRGLSVSKQS